LEDLAMSNLSRRNFIRTAALGAAAIGFADSATSIFTSAARGHTLTGTLQPTGLLWETNFDDTTVVPRAGTTPEYFRDLTGANGINRLAPSAYHANLAQTKHEFDNAIGTMTPTTAAASADFICEVRNGTTAPLGGYNGKYLYTETRNIPVNSGGTMGRINAQSWQVGSPTFQRLQRYEMYLYPQFLTECPANTFFQIQEVGLSTGANGATWGMDFSNNVVNTAQQIGPFGMQMGFRSRPSGGAWKVHWYETTPIKPPVGQWFTLDIFLRGGIDGEATVALNGQVVLHRHFPFTYQQQTDPNSPTLGVIKNWPILKQYIGTAYNQATLTNPWRATRKIAYYSGYQMV
jgi:hypothetical protein